MLHPAITQQSRPHDIGRVVFRYFSMSHSDLREPFYSGKGSTQTFSVDSNKVAHSENFKIFKVLKALGFTPNDAQCTSSLFVFQQGYLFRPKHFATANARLHR